MTIKKIIIMLSLFVPVVIAVPVAKADMDAGVKRDDYIFYAEFDGADDTSLWVPFKSNGTDQYTDGRTSGKIANGVLTTTPASTGFGRWGVSWGENALSAKAGSKYKQNIYLETKFKVQQQFASGERRILDVRGHCEYNNTDKKALFCAGIKNNKLTLGNEVSTTETDYALALDTWYTISSRLDFSAKKVYTTITDEQGNSGEYESGFLWGANFSNIQLISMHQNDAVGPTYVTDYVCLWDGSYRIKNIFPQNGSEDVRIDSDIKIEFSGDVDESSLENIRLLDNNESIIETDITSDGKNVLLYIPCGLRYDTSYKLKIPDTVLSKNGEAVSEKDIVFTTEQKPFVIGNIEKTVSGTTVKASVAVRNHTAQDKRIYLLVMIYDDNGTLVKMDNIEGDIEKGTEKKVSGEIDISGIGVGEVKTYIWNGFSFE